jgi:hypothetical protein
VKSPGKTILDLSLLDEFEQIKLTLQPKSLEEISKIWTALPRVNFRRSVTYEVSVVQIESQQQRSSSPPVRQRRVYALPMRSPQIDEVFVQPAPFPGAKIAAAQEGETLRITGHNFQAPNTSVIIDGASVAIAALRDDQIDVLIPAGQFSVGLHSLQVVQKVALTTIEGQPPALHNAFSSNVVGFQLLPAVTGPAGPGGGPGMISVPVTPAVTARQQRMLLLGDRMVPGVPPQPADPPATNVLFQLPQPPNDPVPPGAYLMRVRIDGAESRLKIDTDRNSPTYLHYVGPTFTV